MSPIIDLAESCHRGDRPWTAHGQHVRNIPPGPGLFKIGMGNCTDGPVKDRRPVAELAGVTLGVAGAEVVEVFADKAVEAGFRRLVWPANTDRLIDQEGKAPPFRPRGSPPCVNRVRHL